VRVESFPRRIFRAGAVPLIAFGVMIFAFSGCTLRTPPSGDWSPSAHVGKPDSLATQQTHIQADTAKTAVAEKPATATQPAVVEKATTVAKPVVTEKPVTATKPAVAEKQTASQRPPNQAKPATAAKPVPVQNQTTAKSQSAKAEPASTVRSVGVESASAAQRQTATEKPAVASKPAAAKKPASTKTVVANKPATAPTQSAAKSDSTGERGRHNPFLYLKKARASTATGSGSTVSDASHSALLSAQNDMNSSPDTTGTAPRTQSQPAQAPTSSTETGSQPGDE